MEYVSGCMEQGAGCRVQGRQEGKVKETRTFGCIQTVYSTVYSLKAQLLLYSFVCALCIDERTGGRVRGECVLLLYN